MTGVALITGGQRGIGFGVAMALKEAGWSIALAAERPVDDAEVRKALSQLGERAIYQQHDLRSTEGIPAFLDNVEARLGPITTFVSNAGIASPVRGDMLEVTPEAFDLVMDVNLKGGFFLAKEVAFRMLNNGTSTYQSMSFITSVSAEMVSIERADYCISKSAAAMMARLFATRLADAGIGVFELRPGIIDTDMTAAVRDRYDTRIADGLVPGKRWGQPSDIGTVVSSIAQGHLAYATGAVIPIDGGLSIPRL